MYSTQYGINGGITSGACSNVGLDQETANVIEWVKRKMEEEEKLDDLCEQHPGLKECRNAFEVMKRLCEDK